MYKQHRTRNAVRSSVTRHYKKLIDKYEKELKSVNFQLYTEESTAMQHLMLGKITTLEKIIKDLKES